MKLTTPPILFIVVLLVLNAVCDGRFSHSREERTWEAVQGASTEA
jgi:hypothetical protein